MALIIVLGLVALIGAWASTAVYEDMLSLRRMENMQDGMRAQQASQSAFALAIKVLRDDAQGSQQDDLDEYWAQQAPAFPIDQGTVTAAIVDANRFINLNDLVDQKGMVQADVEASVKLIFQHLQLDRSLVNRLIDWIDQDSTPYGADGAEEAAYYDSPYKVKNSRLERWRELHFIKGFDEKIVTKLESYFVVRSSPESGKSMVNVNTTPAAVLMAIFPLMTDVDAQAFIESRPYSVVNVSDQPWGKGVNVQGRLSTTSDLFMVRTEARFGRVALREQFMVSRLGEALRLEAREKLEWNRGLQQEEGES